ncbi:hypothetical protein K469DRAFT_61129 [Zopfia rhizophila CBS 207.26]|uniref:lytic cellulose monooxygenase (C4-dehydrogenating) n=1 Tax=Zopfia rhizophila CBS 207.26 TaxID=1314779 RepID=A0A6A6EEI8_9PEZI|nr:hypothetical protein K469DRAFT_61129 [Zopfia rhizophila CBS 207.26]
MLSILLALYRYSTNQHLLLPYTKPNYGILMSFLSHIYLHCLSFTPDIGVFLFTQTVSSYYTFGHLIVNGTVTPKWKYVRNAAGAPEAAANTTGEVCKTRPLYDIFSTDTICGRKASASPKTEGATVIAGDEVSFKVAIDILLETPYICHVGPGQVYMSKVPNNTV